MSTVGKMKKSGKPGLGVQQGTRKPRKTDSGPVRSGSAPAPKQKLPQPVATSTKLTRPSQRDGENNDSAEPEMSLVRYINETMIKKMSGKDNLKEITSLNLTLTTKDDGKKIRYIENLDGLLNLQVLIMSHNQISRIEKLQHLTRLRELDISCNRISKVEGLETLIHLQVLNLSHNLIETVPAWLGRKLKTLRALHIAGNLLYSLSDVFRLRPLKDLIQLSVSGNPLCDLPHHRLFAIFHLRGLQVLDKQTITDIERKHADERFEQEELENLEVQLGEEEKRFKSLQEDHSKTIVEQTQDKNLISSLKTRNLEHQHAIIQLKGELQAKGDLLKRKTAELNKACEKQYRLEQELAFQKIDAKFEPFAFRHDLNETEGGTEESPYIGKAGYKRNKLADHQRVSTPKNHGQDTVNSSLSPDTQGQLQAILQDRLTDKQRQIAAAQDHLSKLQDKIDDTEKTLGEKKREMQSLAAETSRRPLSEAEKQELKGQLWERLQVVNDLRQRVNELESAMGGTLDIIQDKERDMDRLRRQLADGKWPQGAAAPSIVIADKQKEAADAEEKYRTLQRELEDVVGLLADEMERVNRVKKRMAQEKVELNDDVKDELKGALAGLTRYMQDSKQRAAEQDRKYRAVQRERDQLLEQLHRAEQAESGDHSNDKLEQLQRQLDATSAALAAAEAEKDHMRESLLNEQDSWLADRDDQLREAEEETNKLDSALKKQMKQAQAEKDALKQQLDAQQRQIEALGQSADLSREQSHDPEEIDALTSRLHALQKERDALESHLQDQQAQMQEALDSSLHPDDVLARIHKMKRHLENERGMTRPLDDDDILGISLADVEEAVRDKMQGVVSEREKAMRKQREAEQEAEALKRQLAALQEQLDAGESERYEDSPDADFKHDYRVKRKRDLKERVSKPRSEDEDAMVNAMRQEVQKLKEKLRQRPSSYHKDQTQDTLRPRHDPHTTGELRHLEAALNETQRRMRENDKLAADELARAEAEMRHLKAELDRQMEEARNSEQDAARRMEDQKREVDRRAWAEIAQAEARARERAQFAAQELARAEDEMTRLHQALNDREKELHQEVQRGDVTSHTVAEQQHEIGALYDTLEDQKAEILKLQDFLRKFTTPQPGVSSTPNDHDLDHLLQEVDRLNHALQLQRNFMSTSKPGGHSNSDLRHPIVIDPRPPVNNDRAGPFDNQRRPVSDVPPPGQRHHIGVPPQERFDSAIRMQPLNDPGPPVDGRIEPAQYRYAPLPQKVHQMPPRQRNPPPAFKMRNQPPDVTTTSYPEGFHSEPTSVTQAQTTSYSMHAPASHQAVPLPQGGTTAPLTATHIGQSNVTTHGNGTAAPAPPPIQGVGIPRNAGIASTVPPVVMTSAVQQGGNFPGTRVAPPTSQPIITPVPLTSLMGALQGVPTPGCMLGPTVSTQQPTDQSSISGSEDDSPTGNETAETSSERESESAVSSETVKKGKTVILPPGGLFCNVPEHLNMEDKTARLQKLLAECRKSKTKKNELKTLELAVERQRETLRALQDADNALRRERDAALKELQELNANIDRKTQRSNFLEGQQITPEEEDYERLEVSMNEDNLRDEIECLEMTLAKRRTELQVADKLLQECQDDLKEATHKEITRTILLQLGRQPGQGAQLYQQLDCGIPHNSSPDVAWVDEAIETKCLARSTLEDYDKASLNFQRTTEDSQEIEKRSEQVAKDLVQAQEYLEQLQRDVQGLEGERRSQEDKMRAVDEVLQEKDGMFTDLESKIEHATEKLQKLQTSLLLTEEKALQQQENVKQQNQLLADGKEELLRIEQQLDAGTTRLRELDQEICRKQDDLRDLTSDLDVNQKEMLGALRDAENELATLRQRVKETKSTLDDLNHQKRELQVSIDDKRSILNTIHQDTEREDSTLQDIRASIDKSRADLKHTLEMIQLEKMELEALRLQHETKMSDLEKTQLAALQEKAEFETIQVSCQEKRAELERTNKQLSLQRAEKERLMAETSAMEARAVLLHKEEEALEERCQKWDQKMAQLTRKHEDLLDARKTEESKLEELQHELASEQENLDKTKSKRALLTSQFQSYKQQVKEAAKELKSAKEDLLKVKGHWDRNQQEIQDHERQNSEARADLAQLRESIEKSQQSLYRINDEHRTKQEALYRLRKDVKERHLVAQNGQQHVERVQADVEQEENRLSRLIGGLTAEAEHLRSDVALKRQELDEATLRLTEVQTQYKQKQQNGLRVAELQAQITQLEAEVKERLEEKTKLAEALHFSHAEMTSLRKEKETLDKRLSEMKSQLDEAKESLRQAKQRFKEKQRQSKREIEGANMAADAHSLQADRLSSKLKEITDQYIESQSQWQRDLEEERRAKLEALALNKASSMKDEASSIDGMSDLEELEELQRQKAELTRHLVELQSNIQQARLDASLIRDSDFLQDMSCEEDARWRQDKEKLKMQKEQDRLKLQIRQRVSQQADMLDAVKERTNSTLNNLKRKLDNLEGLVSDNSALARSMTSTNASTQGSVTTIEPSTNGSDHYPQHDTSPDKMMTSTGQRSTHRGIFKLSRQVDKASTSHSYLNQRHRWTSPTRTERE